MTVRSDISAPLAPRNPGKTGHLPLAGIAPTRQNDTKGLIVNYLKNEASAAAQAIYQTGGMLMWSIEVRRAHW